MDLELLSSIVGNPVERLANIRAHVDPEIGNEDPELSVTCDIAVVMHCHS